MVALLPRLWGLADFYTVDEAYHWQQRVRLFAEALSEANWAGTDLTGHPGVTTMWLGALGRWLALLAGVREPAMGDGALYLSYLRAPIAVFNSVAIVVSYMLLQRLVRPPAALLGALLWAGSPFLIAHSRLLHLDAVVTSWMTLSVLLLLCGLINPSDRPQTVQPRGWWIAASGVGGGLALLTKGSAFVLLPAIGLLLFAFGPRGLWSRLRSSALWYGVWLFCAGVVIVAVWPAMWVAPLQSLRNVIAEVIGNGGQPHGWGNFFLGRSVADPGWLFYPFVVVWRSTPFTIAGLLLVPLALRRDRRERSVLLALLGFAVLYGVMLSIGAKKFDRYLLPIWPTLELLAASGLVAAAHAIATRLRISGQPRVLLQRFGTAAVVVVLVAQNLVYQPYYLAYYNPVLGGGRAAQQLMLVGWGEGLEQIGDWLAQRPDLANGPVLSEISPALAPFVPQQVLGINASTITALSSYAVLYTRSAEEPDTAEAVAYVRQFQPLYTLRQHGIEYATVYQLPRPYTQAVDAIFDDTVRLRGFSSSLCSDALTITPSWDIQASGQGGMFCFIHVLADDGTRVAQVDLPLDDGLFATWQAGQQFGRPITLPLPSDLPVGSYRVTLGVYNPADGLRGAVTQGTTLPPAMDGPNVVQLMEFTVEAAQAGSTLRDQSSSGQSDF